MRRFLVALSAIGLAGIATIAACSSDDSSGTTPGTDSGTPDTSTPVDSGKPDTGAPKDSGTDAGACQTCSSFLEIGPSGDPCPGSDVLEQDFFNCLCNQDGGPGCYAQCTDTCTSFANPSGSCVTCFQSTCSAQVAACAADGADAGPSSDAGDGGDGG